MPLPTFDQILGVMDQVDKCARVLQRTDDLVQELGTPAGGRVVDMDPDDTTDDGEETREDDAP